MYWKVRRQHVNCSVKGFQDGQCTCGRNLSMMTRPLLPPAHARAMSVLSSSSSGVGTYGGLKICTAGESLFPLQCQNLLSSLCGSPSGICPSHWSCGAAPSEWCWQPTKALACAAICNLDKAQARDLLEQCTNGAPADPPCAASHGERVTADCLSQHPHR